MALLAKLPIFKWHEKSIVTSRRARLADAICDLAPSSVESILDVGCGDGSMTKLIAERIGASDVQGDPDIASVSVVGAGMKTHPGVAATVFETLAKERINIEMISTSAIRVSCVVAESQVEQAAQALHAAFGLAAGPALVD